MGNRVWKRGLRTECMGGEVDSYPPGRYLVPSRAMESLAVWSRADTWSAVKVGLSTYCIWWVGGQTDPERT